MPLGLGDPVVIGIVVVSGLMVGIAIALVIAVMAERRRYIDMFADWDSVIESGKGTLAALREREEELLSCVDGRKLISRI